MTNFLEDPVVKIAEVIGSDAANELIKDGWVLLNSCTISEIDGGNVYSDFKYSLALTKSQETRLKSIQDDPTYKKEFNIVLNEL